MSEGWESWRKALITTAATLVLLGACAAPALATHARVAVCYTSQFVETANPGFNRYPEQDLEVDDRGFAYFQRHFEQMAPMSQEVIDLISVSRTPGRPGLVYLQVYHEGCLIGYFSVTESLFAAETGTAGQDA